MDQMATLTFWKNAIGKHNMTQILKSDRNLTSKKEIKRTYGPSLRWLMLFLGIIVLMGGTLILKKYFMQSEIDLVYNQFYVIRDLSFLSSYQNIHNWLITDTMMTVIQGLPAFYSLLNFEDVVQTLLDSTASLGFSFNFNRNVFKEKSTLDLVNLMNSQDNCELIAHNPINCGDKTSMSILKNGLKGYNSYSLMIKTHLALMMREMKSFSQPITENGKFQIPVDFFDLHGLAFPFHKKKYLVVPNPN